MGTTGDKIVGNTHDRMKSESTWAIVTGASSGIGRALALQFASGGYNLFLTGRDGQALREVAAESTRKHSVRTEHLAVDLSQRGPRSRLIEALELDRRPVEVLINNAGFTVHGDFVSSRIEENLALVDVQLAAALELTRAVLPHMIARQRGRILNVASVYSFSGVPYQSVYAASKAFLLSFSTALGEELKPSGVTVTVLCPGVTQSALRTRAGIAERRRDAGMTAQEVARIAYAETLKGTPIVIPGFLNRLFVGVARILPAASMSALVRWINQKRAGS